MRIVLAVMALLLGCTGANAEERIALVIGNQDYRFVPKLANTANDARAMASLLRAERFEVEEHLNLGNNDLKRVVRDFISRTQNSDVAVVYYAGHGIEVGGINYLVPIDGKLKSDLDVQDEALSLDRVLQVLEPARKLRLVILDACRENPFIANMKRTVASRSVARGLAQVEPSRPNTLIAFAAKAGSTADDGDGGNSPFTESLLKHITEPGLDIRLALGRVRDDVVEKTKNAQEPFVYGSLGGSVVTLSASATPEPTRADGDIARRDFAVAAKLNTIDAWDAFIARYPEGYVSDLARKQRDRLAAREPVTSQQAPAPESARLTFEDADRSKVAEIARRHQLPLPEYSFDNVPPDPAPNLLRFFGVWASVTGFNGGIVQSMIIINGLGENGQLLGHYIIGPPPPNRSDLFPARIIPLRATVVADKLMFATRSAAVEAVLSASADLDSRAVQTGRESSRIQYKPVWRLVARHEFPALSPAKPATVPPVARPRGGSAGAPPPGAASREDIINNPRFPRCNQLAAQRGLSGPTPSRKGFIRRCVLAG